MVQTTDMGSSRSCSRSGSPVSGRETESFLRQQVQDLIAWGEEAVLALAHKDKKFQDLLVSRKAAVGALAIRAAGSSPTRPPPVDGHCSSPKRKEKARSRTPITRTRPKSRTPLKQWQDRRSTAPLSVLLAQAPWRTGGGGNLQHCRPGKDAKGNVGGKRALFEKVSTPPTAASSSAMFRPPPAPPFIFGARHECDQVCEVSSSLAKLEACVTGAVRKELSEQLPQP